MKKTRNILYLFVVLMFVGFASGCEPDAEGVCGCGRSGSSSSSGGAGGCDNGSSGAGNGSSSGAVDNGSSGGTGNDGSSSSSSSGGASTIDIHLEGRIYEGGFYYREGRMYDGGLNLSSTVYLRDSAMLTRSTSSDSDGVFVFDEAGLTPPFILWTSLTPFEPVDQEATFYTTCGNSGTVNISSLTHMVSAMALGRDPINVYGSNPDAPAPAAAEVAAAQQVIHDLLALVYADLGIPSDVDIMIDDIGDEITGYRRIVDMVRGYTMDTYVALYPRPYHRPCLMRDFLNNARPDETVGPEAAYIQLMGMIAAEDYFAFLNGVVEDGAVDAQEQSALISRWAPDFLNRGVGPDQIEGVFSDGDFERLAVYDIEFLEFIRPMYGTDDHPLGALNGISEKGSYEKGFWGLLGFMDCDLPTLKLCSFVFSQGQWLVYGDRSPFNTPFTVQTAGIRVDREYFLTGLKLSIDDQEMVGQSRGIHKVAVFNSALPTIPNPVGDGSASAMILAPHRYGPSDNMFRIAEPADYTQRGPRTFYLTEDGLDRNKMLDDDDFDYFHVALDETGAPVCTWLVFMESTPLAITELQRQAEEYQVFPTLTQVGGITGPPFVIPHGDATGSLTISWQNPDIPGGYIGTTGALIEWINEENEVFTLEGLSELKNPAVTDKTLNFGDWTSAAFNPPPDTWQGSWCDIEVWSREPFGELFVDITVLEIVADETGQQF